MEDAELGEPFERPSAFDLPSFWAASTARLEKAQAPVTVTVRLQPGVRPALERIVGPAATGTIRRIGHLDVDGTETIRFRHESMETAYLDLLRLGGRAEAIGPAELREWLVAATRGLADRYGVTPGTG